MTPGDLRFTKEHEWVRVEDDEAIFGLSDHAQKKLGDITFVELPEIGKIVRQFAAFSVVESVKAANDIFAPLSGEILQVNSLLENAPEKINQSPYDEGWICRIRIADLDEMNNLMNASEYDGYVEGLES